MLDQPDLASQWNNNFLICLAAENETHLKNLLTKLNALGVQTSYFLEPDYGHELTGISFIATKASAKVTSCLPLALKEYAPVQLVTAESSQSINA